ncbi:MAG: ABC transporter ATP-binding protein [Candidatus Tectomicrobia bacterium]|nr:ABC transporter ATP-binding protein [Candidatus Tectomicrobia bacterium]
MQSPKDGVLLKVKGLVKRFGGLAAVNGIDCDLRAGELRAIIGPNGAGKTTFFNLLTGRFPPTAGRVHFKGEDITGLSPDRITRKGIGRSFQVTSIFPNLTALENVQPAVQSRLGAPHPFRSLWSRRETWDKAEEVLGIVGLAERRDVRAAELSHGEQKLVDIAIALAGDPELLLLDEPTAGLSAVETRAVTDRIQGLADRRTVLLVEHDMKVVMSLARRISVFHQGKVLAEGAPEEIRSNEDVRRVYLTRGA